MFSKEQEAAFYVIVARLIRPLRERLSSPDYRLFGPDIEAGKFVYQPYGRSRPHRFILLRRPVPDESNHQLTLFTLRSYCYQILLTSLTLQPINVWKFYNGRAPGELIIRDLLSVGVNSNSSLRHQ